MSSSNPIVGPWASGSYGTTGTFTGIITSINDPLRRNRVQVRIHGYESDKGNIPDDKLSWYSVMSTSSSQLAGSSSTHGYYPGAQVALIMIGTEMMVIGSTAGFDSDKRKGQGQASGGEQPDVPRQTQGKGKRQGEVSDGEGKDTVHPTSREPKTDEPYSPPNEVDAYQHSRDKAPYNQGERAKNPDLKSIGNLKMQGGSDILQMIQGMDGNKSGAIQKGVELIQKLRKSSFGTSKEMIGSGLMQQAAQQASSEFSAPPMIDLLSILRELIACWKLVEGVRDKSLDWNRCISALSPETLQVSSSVLTNIETAGQNLLISNLSDNSSFLSVIRDEYLTGLHQAFSGITSYLRETAQKTGSSRGVQGLFKEPAAYQEMMSLLTQLGGLIGTAPAQLEAIGKSNTQTPAGGSNMQMLSQIMNAFSSNPIAQSEVGGQINPQSLLKIPLKYTKKKQNDPMQAFASLFQQIGQQSGGGSQAPSPAVLDQRRDPEAPSFFIDEDTEPPEDPPIYITSNNMATYSANLSVNNAVYLNGQPASYYAANSQILPIANSTQAVAGTSNSYAMTPWSTAQAIAAIGKNYIVNGAMRISQENGTTAGTTSGYYPVDMFAMFYTNSGTQTAQQVASVTPAGSPYRLRLTCTVADASVAAGDYCHIEYKMEGIDAADLRAGSASAKTIAIRFGVRAPAGTYGVSIRNKAFNRSYVAEYTISALEANTDVVKTVVIPLDQTGTWDSDNTTGFVINWNLMCGSTYQTTAGAWQAGSYVSTASQYNFMGTGGNVFELFDVGLYASGEAPAVYELKDYTEELRKCRRYWRSSYLLGTRPGTATSVNQFRTFAASTSNFATVAQWMLEERMRATPTGTVYSPGTGTSGKIQNTDFATDVNGAVTVTGDSYAHVYVNNVSVGVSQGIACHVVLDARM